MQLYVITKKDKGYLQQTTEGKHTITTNKVSATKFTYDKATSFINNCIAPNQRELYSLKEIKSVKSKLGEIVSSFADICSSSQALGIDSVTDDCDVPVFDMVNFDWLGNLSYFSKFFTMLPQYKESLKVRFAEVEDKKIDIEHYIEFNQLNARDGYKAYKLMYGIRQERRFIKNEMQKVDILLDSTLSDITGEKVVARLNGLNNRKYKPRSLYELFPNYNSD